MLSATEARKRRCMKLWHRNLALGSPINGFLRNVRWEGEGAGEGGSGGEGGAAGGGSGAGAGAGAAGSDGAGGAAGQGAGADWRAGFDPAIKDHAALKDFKDPASLAKSYVEAQKLIGVDKIPVPQGFSDKPEIREKFLNEIADRLGRPKEAKEYKITDVKLPEGVSFKVAPEALDALKVQAHKLGLLPHQLDGLYNWYMTDSANKIKAQQDTIKKNIGDAEAELRSEWGSAFDAKKGLAEKVLDKFATAEERAHLIKTGFNNDPKIIRMLARFGETVSEDTFEKGGGETTMTPQEAESELTTVRAKLLKMNQSDPEYKAVLKRRNELMEMATPNKEGKA